MTKKKYTCKEFDKLCKQDKSFKKAYDDWVLFESWLANQSMGLQQEIDHKCREYIENLYGKENI